MAIPKDLIKWPTKESEVTIDGMLRVLGVELQHVWLQKQRAIKDGERLAGPLYMARTEAIISGVGLMAAIRALRDSNPDKAHEFVKDYWNLCDSGDAFGELLWQYLSDAGLDPALVSLDES